MIIPLVGQASCQGVSSAWGHQALQGWACQQSSEGSKEEPFGGSQNRQKRQRGSKHSPEAPTQGRQQVRGTKLDSKREVEPNNHRGINTAFSRPGSTEAAGGYRSGNSNVKMLAFESWLHHFLALCSW